MGSIIKTSFLGKFHRIESYFQHKLFRARHIEENVVKQVQLSKIKKTRLGVINKMVNRGSLPS